MVLYIFGVRDTHWLKLGFTSHCPWSSARDGFWKHVHPPDCCGKLGWSDLELLALAPGTLEDKTAVKNVVPGHHGEFWSREQLEPLRQAILDVNGEQHGLPLPPRPAPPAPGRREGKLACCGGSSHVCTECGRSFPSRVKLLQHDDDVHRRNRVECACGMRVISRNLERHWESETCKRARHAGIVFPQAWNRLG